jgi:benzoyl-CoA reductase/2-hydroxyglutaryl-CoA dehydratase subunit BcrC/BadD/HgdB
MNQKNKNGAEKSPPLEIMQKHYQQRDMAAKEWKKKGGKIVGYLCDSVPDELISAAGFFPLRISGNPLSSTEQADKYTDPYDEGFVRSMFSMILSGQYNFLDYIVIPHSRDSIYGLFRFLSEIQSTDKSLKIPELYLFDIPHTRYWTSGLYNRDRFGDFKKKLEEWSGKPISTNSLQKTISIANENRSLLKKIAALRAAEHPCISGVEALQIIGSSMFMLKEEHNKLLKRFLEKANLLPPLEGVRLFVEGSPLDNLQLYELVESCGALIVGEDNCWGNRYTDNPVDELPEPLEAVADRYHLKSPCAWMCPMKPGVEYCVQKAIETKAQGVIFYIAEWDYAQTWNYPEQKRLLEERQIPNLCLNRQKYLIPDPEKLRIIIEEFVRKIADKR